MKINIEKDFSRMDELSQRGEAFVFLIDFLQENAEVLTVEELQNQSEILVGFEGYTNSENKSDFPHEIRLKGFPESFESYQKGFDIVMENLKTGNSYLVNYTRKTKIETNLSLEDIFHHSKAKYKVLYKNRWVCFSPEIFVKIKENRISTFPMKGTIDADIPQAKEILKNNPKEIAEHYTVVDLLRNDLSRIANKVRVVDFQKIDYLQTQNKNLYAMSSEIQGQVKPEFQQKIGSILRELLPAGSILGAPKEKTLEIVLESEQYSRGYYSGICGYFDGKNLDTGVMIRFIEQENNQLFFKSGGGITHNSIAKSEYEEVINKIYVPIY